MTAMMAAPTWDEMERSYVDSARVRREQEDAKIHEQYEERRKAIDDELVSLYREKHHAEAQLQVILHSIRTQEYERDSLHARLAEERSKLARKRDDEDREKTTWFKQQRALRKDPSEPMDMSPPAASTRSNGRRASKRDSGGRRSTGGWTSINGAQPAEDAEPAPEPGSVVQPIRRIPMEDVVNGGIKMNGGRKEVYVLDSRGSNHGTLRFYDQHDGFGNVLASFPIKRHVTLRQGERLSDSEWHSIYQTTYAKKPYKWISCMIQAVGEVQQQPCTHCARGQGFFNECVMVHDSTGALPNCGNCEWNHQRCSSAIGVVVDDLPKQRHKLPDFPPVAPAPTYFDGTQSVLSDRTTKPKAGGRKSLPVLPQHSTSMEQDSATESATEVKKESEVLTEINRETLLLKNDGRAYTYPPMYEGVPLEKIKFGDEYWDPSWEDLLGIIEPQLDKWKEKLETLKNTPEAVRHTVFLANRQVNRGQSVVDFLKDETSEFHPYQYVGKEMMNKFYKTFVNYDTLFRLVNVHEELKKFDLDITPLEWLRQRMYELSELQKDKFSLSKITHDLYHDAKLKALREKHGFGNIGRPSGYKLGSRTNPDGTPKEKSGRQSTGGSTRRKRVSSIKQPRIDDPNNDIFQPPNQEEYLQPVTPRLQKRQRLEPAPAPALPPEPPVPIDPYENDLDYDGWTSTDSFSAGRIMHLDWRVGQIKTTSLTTSTEVTQYWTWKADENLFEHQVLRDVFPKVTWGYYQKPIDFNLRLDDIQEIEYASDSKKIVVHLLEGGKDPRGSVLAAFKRERTKRRFLAFARKKGVQLVKSTLGDVEHAWTTMVSEELHNDDSEK